MLLKQLHPHCSLYIKNLLQIGYQWLKNLLPFKSSCSGELEGGELEESELKVGCLEVDEVVGTGEEWIRFN